MSDPTDDDMDEPLTKREFRAAIDTELVTKRELNAAFADLHTGMKNLFDTVLAKIEEVSGGLKGEMKALEIRLTADVKSHAGSNADQLKREVGLVDDRYRDLPDRVEKLETAVFAPEPRAKKQRRR